uniref:Zinc finger protein 740 n=1 Tax=Anas zonorhyncha TaxID=75864 RepID=A0A8B9ULC1_9AVES
MVVIKQNGSFQLSSTKNFICELCYGAFRSSYHLKRHILIHTGKDPPETTPPPLINRPGLIASRRGRRFPPLSTPVPPPGEKPFECDVCDMRFIQKYHLERHKRVHSGEKPYQCERCMQSFSRTDRLLRHKRMCQGCQTKAPEAQLLL